MLYKEILKAISKRELLEDLCFCACRKRPFAWRLSPSLLASSLTSLPFGLRWLASFRSRRSKALLFTFWTRANFVSDESQARTIICHRQSTVALCAELPSDQPTTVDCPSDKLTNFTSYSPFHYVQGFSKSVAKASLFADGSSSSSLNPIPTPTILITTVIPL